jgi:hypothetical protein
MSATGPKTFILDHDPLTPLDSLTPPTPEAVRRLRQELYTNAQNVASSLGGGDHGHLGMLMPTERYTEISTGATEYIFPTAPEIPAYSSTNAIRERQLSQYRKDIKEYEAAQALRNQLKALLLRAIPESYREVLADPDLGYVNVTPQDILQHMIKNYGQITEQDLSHNLKALETPWDPETTITTVFINGNRCRKFAREGEDPITDKTYIRALVTIFRNSGVLEDAIKDWDKLPPDRKTVDYAIQHFTQADKLRREAQQHLKDALTANAAWHTPAPAPTVPSGTALLTGQPQLPPPPSPRIEGWGYCWSHGVSKHDGYTCLRPHAGHIKEATISNRQGGVWNVSRGPAEPRPNRRQRKRKSGDTGTANDTSS